MKKRVTTQVFALPENDADRAKFLDGVKALSEECKATWLAGSANNEMDYVEQLEKELADHIGDQGVEGIRQDFEKGARAG